MPRPVRSLRAVASVLAALSFVADAASAQRADTIGRAASDTNPVRALQWRLIGPFRGGRSNAVAGIPGQPLVYYAGYTGGGVWKTENAGHTWRNISDGHLRSGSIGAVTVAPSDPNVVWVATGEHAVRGQSSSYGDGVYRSTDAGRTWTHVGLERTKQLSNVVVHPNDPDVAWVAAQGDRWVGTADRGIYHTRDAGRTWTKQLAGVNPTSGAADLAMDPTNPRILYAAFWDHQRRPWQVRSGGAGSGIWKTTDGGATWTRLTDGLPAVMGKVGVAVSPSNAERIYAIVEAERGGVYRSDDAGKTWRLTSGDRNVQSRSWYYHKLTVDPSNADVVWVMNADVMKSIDGGRTFQRVAATHSDNHRLWINPTDARFMINANDGGASISLDGGRTWSTQDNQPTAQFYHVTVDDVYPYRLYSGQQDNSAVSIASRSDGSSIGPRDWTDGAGCESANIGVDRRNPRYQYGGCYQGIFEELDTQTGLTRAVMVYPALNLTEPTGETRYRFNWTAPTVVSQHDPRVIYYGGNVLFRSNDRGRSWQPISPDLTRDDSTTQGPGGAPITNEGAGGEVYGTLVAVAESPHDANTLLVGSDDGRVQLTRDGGRTWADVTPRDAGAGSANEVEISPNDAATLYVAFRRDRHGDYTPLAYRSTDAGRTWTRITNGFRPDEPVRVVREDPARRGLLYAGTETGAYISYDAGASWRPLQRNLPTVPITDLEVRHGDLYAATEGRAFWVLDDLTPLREAAPAITRAPLHLFTVRPALLAGGNAAPTTTAGRNPMPGARVWMSFASRPDSARIEFLDAGGRVLHALTRGDSNSVPRRTVVLTEGLNAVSWNLRADPPARLPGGIVVWGGETGGYRVPPGRYQVRVTANGATATQPFEVRQDPRLEASPADVAARDSLARAINRRVDEVHRAFLRLRAAREQTAQFVERAKGTPQETAIAAKGREIVTGAERLEAELSTRAANGQDVINYRNGLNAQYAFLLGNVESNVDVTAGARERLGDLDRSWAATRARVDTLLERDVAAFNALLRDAGLAGVVVREPTANALVP